MAEIKKATDLPKYAGDKYILQGSAGSGKSTLVTTAPGKTLVFALDPAAHAAYQGHTHIDIIEYRNELLDITPYSLTKANRVNQAPITNAPEPKTFMKFGKDFETLWNNGTLEKYNNIAFDGITTLSELAMDYVQHGNQRYGGPIG